jgi:hypothetical protein
MRLTVDAVPSQGPSYPPDATESLPVEFTPGAKLEAGYVRFVCILPTHVYDDPNTIRCRTRITRSGPGSIPYLALSYAWGDPTPKHAIFVDGVRRLIAENLWQFLREARTKPAQFSCWLWIDALSIDQSDTEERRHQVGIMSWIFRNALEVIVWLGPSYDGSDVAMKVLYWQGKPNESFSLSRWIDWNWKWANSILSAIVNLCRRPFWKRLWVFQELRHAEDIRLMCGKYIITWAAFGSLRSVVNELSRLRYHTTHALEPSLATQMIYLRTKPINFSLLNLLKETRNLDCADEHDRVYALLSVATEGHEDIDADYEASLSSLAHSVLRNEYTLRQPKFLSNVFWDCDFLWNVLRLKRTHIFGYGNPTEIVWERSPKSSWAAWAEHNCHLAVAKLLLDRETPSLCTIATGYDRYF